MQNIKKIYTFFKPCYISYKSANRKKNVSNNTYGHSNNQIDVKCQHLL